MWGLRVFVKGLHDSYRSSNETKNVFIYGCMTGGVALAKSIQNSIDRKYHLAGFVSGDQSLDGSWLLGAQVHYDTDAVAQKMQEKSASVLLVSPIQSERFTNRPTLINALINANIQIMMMPPAEEWDGKSDLSHNQLREVEIEDLLPRQKIEVDMDAIGQMLRGKRILITGAAGSIGSEMARQVAKVQPAELVLVDQAETPMHDVRLYMANNHKDLKCLTIVSSITDQEHMEKIFSEHKPEYVFHAAAYKHVPMMEDNPGQAVRNNIYGTRVIVDLAQRMIALSGAKDVKIEFSGLRDGEKLYEELLATKENTKPTHHPKIMVAQVREYPYDLALQNEIELHELSKGFDDMAIVKKMKEIVPEFKSQNSKYQELDK